MTKPTQLMPELLHIRAVIDEQWRIHGPDDNIVISRVEVERLIADNDRLREALEKKVMAPDYHEKFPTHAQHLAYEAGFLACRYEAESIADEAENGYIAGRIRALNPKKADETPR